MTTNSKEKPQTTRYCSPNCQFFKCSKRAMGPKTTVRGRTRITCTFVDGDLCTGSRCTYSFCVKHKLKTDGTCGLTDRPVQQVDDDSIEAKFEKELVKKDKESSKYEKQLKDKYRKKLQPKGKKW